MCSDMQDKAKQYRNFLVMSSCSPKMKLQLKGWRYEDVIGMQPELHVVVDTITQWELQRCMQQWEWHLVPCINSKGKLL